MTRAIYATATLTDGLRAKSVELLAYRTKRGGKVVQGFRWHTAKEMHPADVISDVPYEVDGYVVGGWCKGFSSVLRAVDAAVRHPKFSNIITREGAAL